ncbi:Prepilin type IV endopeptidase, peptidase domain containing protein [Candidatus Nanopelagicaceae bacterium]
MLRYLVLALSIFIIVQDFRTHRISNKTLLVLTSLLLITAHPTSFTKALISIVLAAMIFTLAKIGMGDLKLFVGLIATQGELIITLDYMNLLFLTLAFTLLSHLIFRRTLQGSLAFAHVLLAPFVILYLAI